MKQWHCVVNGRRYGPVSQEDLTQWLAEGRAGPADHVWTEGMAQWARAGDVPELAPPAANDLPAAPSAPPPVQQPLRAHRGGIILALGIISIVAFCLVDVVCGIIGWVMANRDLEDMRAGRMDRSGESLTNGGRICCIIGVILGCLGLCGGIAWLLLWGGLLAGSAAFQ
jgi:hypothetical protein